MTDGMTIDIITYTDAQLSQLSEEQLLEVKEAQQKKNRLEVQLAEALRKKKEKLIENGMFVSDIWKLTQEKLRAEYDAEIAGVREALLFYLRFAVKPQEGQATDAPYELDYSLTYAERYFAVRAYYETEYTDKKERFDAFKQDKIAMQYLGYTYKTLYDVFYTE